MLFVPFDPHLLHIVFVTIYATSSSILDCSPKGINQDEDSD